MPVPVRTSFNAWSRLVKIHNLSGLNGEEKYWNLYQGSRILTGKTESSFKSFKFISGEFFLFLVSLLISNKGTQVNLNHTPYKEEAKFKFMTYEKEEEMKR